MENLKNQSLTLEYQKKLTVTGVESVDGFTDQSLKLTVSGKKMIIIGEGIKISAFNKNTGVLEADGVFNEIKYVTKQQPILKRIFK